MREQLNDTLQLYHMNTLRDMAAYLRLSPQQMSSRKSTLIKELHREIRALAKSNKYIDALDEAEKAVLGILLDNDGFGTQGDIALPLMMAGLVYTEGLEQTRNFPRMPEVLLRLLRRGLIVNYSEPPGTSTRRTFDHVSKVGIAPEVFGLLPRHKLSPPQPDKLPQLAKAPPHVVSGAPEQFLRQLFFIWSELRNQPAKRLKAGGMSKRDRRRIAKALNLDVDEDEAYLAWLYTLLMSLNLVQEKRKTVEAVDNDASTLFWDARSAQQLRDILKQYCGLDQQLSLNTRELTRYYYYSYLPMRPTSEIRLTVLDMLEKFARAHWMPFKLFFTFLSQQKPGGLVLDDATRGALYKNLRWYGSHNRTDLDQALNSLDHQAILIILSELQELGVVDLGYETPEATTPVAIQATDVGRAYFTNDSALASSDHPGQVILQPDFQLLAMGPVPLRVLANLERFAAREKLDDSVITYRLSRDSAYQAFQRGESAKSIRLFLEDATNQSVPQNVLRSLEEWLGQYERIVIRRHIAVLQIDNVDILERMLNDAPLSRYLHRLDARTAWVHTQNLSKVKKRMTALELLPTYSNGPDADLPRSLHWQDDTLRARHALPSLYVTGNIRRVAEPAEDGWRVTPQSIQAAVATGITVPDIVALLEQMTGKSLPLTWEKRLKAWGKHYGDSQVADVKLLRLESDQALQEIRKADKDLHRWLRPLPKSSGLAVVNTRHWDDVQTHLAEWGIHIVEDRWW